MAEEPELQKTPEATPPPESTPATPTAEEVTPEQATQYLADHGVDLSNPEVQEAIMNDSEADDLIKKFGKAPEPTPTPSEEEEPEPTPKHSEGDEPENKKGKKFRTEAVDDDDAAIFALQKTLSKREGRKVPFNEAASKFFETMGKQGDKAPSEPAEPVIDPQVAQLDTEIAAKDTAIAELQKKIKAAKDDAEFDEAFDLQEELFELKSDRRDLTRDKKSYEQNAQAQSEADYNRGVAASSQRVSTDFPALGKKGSIERRAFDAFISEHDGNDPIFQNVEWPEILADKFAEEYPSIRQSPAPSTDGKGTPPKQSKTPANPSARTPSRADMLDGGMGGPTSPAPTDEGNKPPTLDEALDMYAKDTAGMSRADKEAYDRELYKSMSAAKSQPR